MTAPTTATGGRAMVNVFDGTRNLYSDGAEILITVRDGKIIRSFDYFSHQEALKAVGLEE